MESHTGVDSDRGRKRAKNQDMVQETEPIEGQKSSQTQLYISYGADLGIKSETLAFQSDPRPKCPACYKVDEGKGLRKSFCYGGLLSTCICATCRTSKRRTVISGEIATLKMPQLISPHFCVNLHKIIKLLGVCRIIPSVPDSLLSDLASTLVRSCEDQLPIDDWQTFEVEDNVIARRMFNVNFAPHTNFILYKCVCVTATS